MKLEGLNEEKNADSLGEKGNQRFRKVRQFLATLRVDPYRTLNYIAFSVYAIINLLVTVSELPQSVLELRDVFATNITFDLDWASVFCQLIPELPNAT